MQYVMKIALLSGKQVLDDAVEWQELNKKYVDDWNEVIVKISKGLILGILPKENVLCAYADF